MANIEKLDKFWDAKKSSSIVLFSNKTSGFNINIRRKRGWVLKGENSTGEIE